MANVRTSGASLIDVLDRVLDKGIVVDAWVKISLVGLDLLTLQARVVVASFETYLKHSNNIANSALVGAPDNRMLRARTCTEPISSLDSSSANWVSTESLQSRFRRAGKRTPI